MSADASRKVLLLDVDGVLVRSPFPQVLRERYGITTDVTREFFLGPFQDCSLGRGDLLDSLAPYLPNWGWTSTIDAFIDFWFTAGTVLDTQVVSAVRAYRQAGLECWLATDQERHRLQHLLTKLRLAEEVDGCFSSADLGAFKFEPSFWAQVTQRLGLAGDRLLLVDDNAPNVETARAAGLQAEVYQELPDLHEALACHFQIGLTS